MRAVINDYCNQHNIPQNIRDRLLVLEPNQNEKVVQGDGQEENQFEFRYPMYFSANDKAEVKNNITKFIQSSMCLWKDIEAANASLQRYCETLASKYQNKYQQPVQINAKLQKLFTNKMYDYTRDNEITESTEMQRRLSDVLHVNPKEVKIFHRLGQQGVVDAMVPADKNEINAKRLSVAKITFFKSYGVENTGLLVPYINGAKNPGENGIENDLDSTSGAINEAYLNTLTKLTPNG